MTDNTNKRTVIITGANTGIGFRAAQVLADKAYRVILACRNEQRAEDAVKRIKDENPEADVSYQLLDLADISSVERFAEWFLSTDQSLHALVNNAGIVPGEGPRETTKDGYECVFVVNHLGHFLLTMLLLHKLKSTAAEMGEARIINVASLAHNNELFGRVICKDVKGVDFDDLNLENPDNYMPMRAYANSKAANIMFTKALTRCLEGSGVVANTMCPGFVPDTEIFRNADWLRQMEFEAVKQGILPAESVDDGAQHIVHLVDDEKFKDVSGIFYKGFKESPSTDEVNDEENQNRLWMKSCELLNRNDFKDLLNQ